ncbi:hypothetical protein [Litorimonas sp. WD9-15]|uniref:hypothetical protein n=1 Tax=Litorimonas sp. WD9-15 TaxID=3418716 RepID=UPI003D04D673
MTAVMINADVMSLVEAELHSGERLLWADKSRKMAMTILEKGIVGFLVFWLFMVALITLPTFFSGSETFKITVNDVPKTVGLKEYLLFLSIFPIFGFGMLAFVLAVVKIRTGQVYAVTNQRSILISKFIMCRVSSIFHGQINRIERSGKSDFGTIEFVTSESRSFFFRGMNLLQMRAFSGIENPKHVEALLITLKKEEENL